MSHDIRELAELPVRRLERMPALLRLLIPIFLAVGLVALVGAFLTDADRAWRAYHFNWLFFTSVAQGAVILAVVVTITRGLWSRPVRRLALSFVAFMPIAFVLVLPMLLFGADSIFPWVRDPGSMQSGKDAYLNVPFLSLRTVVLLGVLILLDLAFAYWALRPDLGRLRDSVDQHLRGLYGRFSGNWQGLEIEEMRSYRKIAKLGPLTAAVWAIAFGVLAWDYVMSLEPHWFSTMIGPYFFMTGFLGGIAATGLLCVLHVLRNNQGDVILGQNFHDLGKLTFGFCVFWAYLFYSQFIVIWYGMLPIEQAWINHRFGMPFQPFMIAVFFCLFVLPFFGLLGVTPKRRPRIYALFASIIVIGVWLERFILVYPSHYAGGDNVPFGWPEIGIALFFAGLLLSAMMWFQTRFPIYQIWQPVSEIELLGVEEPQAA